MLRDSLIASEISTVPYRSVACTVAPTNFQWTPLRDPSQLTKPYLTTSGPPGESATG